MRVLLVHNPGAGEGEQDSGALTRIIESAGHTVRVVDRKNERIGELAESVDLVAVAGGDGTVTTVAESLASTKTPMTILPAGTANNLAFSVGIEGEPAELVPAWAHAPVVPFDALRVSHPRGTELLFESAGLGLFTEAMCLALSHKNGDEKFTPEERFERDFRLLRQLAGTIPSVQCTIEVDGDASEETVVLCEVMNARQIGSRLVLAPSADTGDGLLDLVVVTESERSLMERFLHRDPSDDHPPHLPVRRGRRIRVTSKARRIHLDDRIERFMSGKSSWTLEVEVDPGAVRLLLPPPGAAHRNVGGNG